MYERVNGSGVICGGGSGECASSGATPPGVDNGCAVACETLRASLGGDASWDGVYQTIAAASSYARGGSGSTASLGRAVWDKERFLGGLEVSAYQYGTWLDIQTLVDRRMSRGFESEVYRSLDGSHVIKLNAFAFMDATHDMTNYLDRLLCHNALFTNAQYKLLGFGANTEGSVCMVLSQPYIRSVRAATEEEISEYLRSTGFQWTVISEGFEGWSDGTYELWDARPRNVLVDRKGVLHFIDVVINSIPSGVAPLRYVA